MEPPGGSRSQGACIWRAYLVPEHPCPSLGFLADWGEQISSLSPFHHRPGSNEATSEAISHSNPSSALFLSGILSQSQKAEGQSHANTPSQGSRDRSSWGSIHYLSLKPGVEDSLIQFLLWTHTRHLCVTRKEEGHFCIIQRHLKSVSRLCSWPSLSAAPASAQK